MLKLFKLDRIRYIYNIDRSQESEFVILMYEFIDKLFLSSNLSRMVALREIFSM